MGAGVDMPPAWRKASKGEGCKRSSSLDSKRIVKDKIRSRSGVERSCEEDREGAPSGVLEVDQFGGGGAGRYATAFLESEQICADGLTIVITKASAVINDKKIDLLKSKLISIRKFQPYRIILKK